MAFPMTDEELKKRIRNGTPIKILAVIVKKEAPKDD